MSSPSVTVVIAAHDGQDFLAEAIESIRSQTLEDIELLVVDDGSRDGTEAVAAAHAERDARVRVIRGSFGSAGAARNAGWREARSPYVAILDQDDLAYPDRLALQRAYLDAHPDVAAVGALCDVIDARGRKSGSTGDTSGVVDFRGKVAPNFHIVHSTAMIRRLVLEEVGGYLEIPGTACEDTDLFLRIGERYLLAGIPQSAGAWRVHGANSSEDVGRMVRWSLATQAAHRLRTLGRPDPLERRGSPVEPTLAELRALGVGPSDYARTLFATHLLWTRLSLAVGDLTGAESHLCAARETRFGRTVQEVSRLRFAEAAVAHATGRRVRTVRKVAASVLLSPSTAVKEAKHPVLGGLGRRGYAALPQGWKGPLAPVRDRAVALLNRG